MVTTSQKKTSDQTWRLHVVGVVQSVGFRPFVKRLADEMSIFGHVKNLGNKGVEILINGDKELVDTFMQMLRERKPPLSEIYKVHLSQVAREDFVSFSILPSSKNKDQTTGISPIPPDVAMCDSCQHDILGKGRRTGYAFTSCTDCGPRFTTITKLPYDRPHTTFVDFPLCNECNDEYIEPSNRRFHAQTTCCSECGPRYEIYLKNGERIDYSISTVVQSIKKGKTIALMGQGGSHYCVDGLNQVAVKELREKRRKRSNKPFAVMMPDIETIEKYCFLSDKQKMLIVSPRRPIVILRTKEPEIFHEIAPRMQSLGVMLPYTGFHYLLFQSGAPEILVMTSANLPNLPMPITPSSLRNDSSDVADVILIHNREIEQRVDDTVIRSHPNRNLIIRRSRGYVPSPIFHGHIDNFPNILALGSEEVNTACILADSKFIATQHIGHITNLELLDFQRSSIEHLLNLFDVNPAYIAVDLHPQFLVRKNLDILRDLSDDRILDIQHHAAHAASLLVDHDLSLEDRYLIWSIDGFGYGSDGNAWGGELLRLEDGGWDRVSSLTEIPYPGGDRTAKYPDRMMLTYLNQLSIEDKQLEEIAIKHLPYGVNELRIFQSELKDYNGVVTSSLGRLLDATSSLLDICHFRSYRGEPAIILEQVALQAKHILPVNEEFVLSGRLDGLSIFEEAYTLSKLHDQTEVASWLLRTVGHNMANQSLKLRKDDTAIGISGGVAYNYLITEEFERNLISQEVEVLIHDKIPPGDGGISYGQAYIGGWNVK